MKTYRDTRHVELAPVRTTKGEQRCGIECNEAYREQMTQRAVEKYAAMGMFVDGRYPHKRVASINWKAKAKLPVYDDRGRKWESTAILAAELGISESAVRQAIYHKYSCRGLKLFRKPFTGAGGT